MSKSSVWMWWQVGAGLGLDYLSRDVVGDFPPAGEGCRGRRLFFWERRGGSESSFHQFYVYCELVGSARTAGIVSKEFCYLLDLIPNPFRYVCYHL